VHARRRFQARHGTHVRWCVLVEEFVWMVILRKRRPVVSLRTTVYETLVSSDALIDVSALPVYYGCCISVATAF
jgi:hypothetical protein